MNDSFVRFFKTKRIFIEAVPEKIRRFFYSDLYLALFAALFFLSWYLAIPLIGIIAISLLGSVQLIISRDALPLVPLLLFAPMIFPIRQIEFSGLFYLGYIPLIVSGVFHIIYYPPRIRRGKLTAPLFFVSVALLISGCTVISLEEFESSFRYMLRLGFEALAIYIVLNCYIEENPFVKPSAFFAKTLLYMGIFITLQVVSYYLIYKLPVAEWGQEKWLVVGWGIDNNAATVMLLCAPMCFYLAGVSLSRLKAFLCSLAGIIIYAGICLSFSRGAILMALVTFPFMFALCLKKSKRKLMVFVPLVIATIVALAVYLGFFSKINEMFKNIFEGGGAGWAGRDILYLEAVECFKKYPLFGAGMPYKGKNFDWTISGFYYFHSTFFEVMGKMGLFGLFAYGWLYAVRFKVAVKNIRYNLFKLMAFFSLLGFELYCMLDTGIFIPFPTFICAVLFCLIGERENSEVKPFSKPLPFI